MLFGDELGLNVAAVVLPFAVVLGITAMVHNGFPWTRKSMTRNTEVDQV